MLWWMCSPQSTVLMNTLQRIELQTSEKKKSQIQINLWRQIANIADSDCVDFSSNDYLGLGANTFETPIDAPFGSSASRLVFQKVNSLGEIEKLFAAWVEWPEAVYCSSGFLANLAIFDAVANLNDIECYMDIRAHASFHVGARAAKIKPKYFRHKDYSQLETLLTHSAIKNKIIFVESLHSMDGDFEDADALLNLCRKYDACLVVDEAHSAAIVGCQGQGWINLYPQLKNYVLAVMYGCGKGIGVSGGLIACQLTFKELIVNCSKGFIYTTAQSPVVVEALKQNLQVIVSSRGDVVRKKLQENIIFAQTIAHQLGLNHFVSHQNSPIAYYLCGKEEKANRLSDFLQKNKFLVRAMRPPTVPRLTARLRLVFRARHTQTEITRLLENLKLWEKDNE